MEKRWSMYLLDVKWRRSVSELFSATDCVAAQVIVTLGRSLQDFNWVNEHDTVLR